jgi:GGDEF domain-containing protein
MELVTGLDTQVFVIFLGVVVALGCTLVAFLVDFLKGKNERLREQVLEMTVRQEERARLPQVQMDSAAVLSAIAQVGKNLEVVVRAAVNPHAATAPAPVSEPVYTEPVYQPRPAATVSPLVSPLLFTEQPAVEPVPVAETPVAETPAAETPVAETPVAETPVAETPVAETPVAETPVAETPVAETPVAEPPVAEPAVADLVAAEAVEAQPLADETVAIPEPVAGTPATPEISTPEPDWRIATWHEETVAHVQAAALEEQTETAAVEPDEPPVARPEDPVVTTSPIRESLRSLFESPAASRPSQLEIERRLEEQLPEVVEEEPSPVAEIPPAFEPSAEPVVRIRVLSNNVASVLEETPIEEPVAQVEEAQTMEEEVYAEAVVEEPVDVPEELPVTAPVDFLTDEPEAPAPLESFDSLMAAVNAEPAVAPEPLPVEPEDPGVLALPAGMNDRATLDFLKRDKALFTGLIVSIGINDYARLQETSGRPAAEELAKSVSQLVKSLITAPNGSEFFGCRASDDEFILVFAGENGSVAQRRLNGLSERLWDFQLRSLGNFSVMFSWGATEANSEAFADSVEAASERMRETRHNRRTISMEKTRLKKVVNG